MLGQQWRGRPETAVLPEWFFVASLSSLPFITQVPHTHTLRTNILVYTVRATVYRPKRNKYLSLLKRQPRKEKKYIKVPIK